MHETHIRVESPHLHKRMPVGDRFSWICEHFTPVFPTKVVCVVTNTTHTDHLVVAYAVGVEKETV